MKHIQYFAKQRCFTNILMMFCFAILCNIVNAADTKGNSKFIFYSQQERIFISEEGSTYNISIELTAMSKDGNKVVVFGQDKGTSCKRAIVMKKDGSGIEEIDLSHTCSINTAITAIDINHDGSIVYWVENVINNYSIYKYEDGTTTLLLNENDEVANGLDNISQMVCTPDNEEIFLRDWPSGIFKLTYSDSIYLEHIIKSEDLETDERFPNRYDTDMSVSDDGNKILFGITGYYRPGNYTIASQGNESANELWLWKNGEYNFITKNNTFSTLSPIEISGDGQKYIFKNNEGVIVAVNDTAGSDTIPIISKSITLASLSYNGANIAANNYFGHTDGSVGSQMNNLANLFTSTINDSGNIVGLRYGYNDRYYVAYINLTDSIPDAPKIQDISFTVVKADEDQTLFKIALVYTDSDGLSDIDQITAVNMNRKTGELGYGIRLGDNGIYGDDIAGDGLYKGDNWFNNYDTIMIRVQVIDKSGNITVADVMHYVDPLAAQSNQVSPNFALIDQDTVEIEIKGEIFDDQSTVKFRKDDGYAAIPFETIVLTPQLISVKLEVTNMYVGEYDIIISRGGDSIILENGFRLLDQASIPFGEWVSFTSNHGSAFFSAVDVPPVDQLFVFVKKSIRAGYASTWKGQVRLIQDGKDIALQTDGNNYASDLVGGTYTDYVIEQPDAVEGLCTFEIDNFKADIQGKGQIMFAENPPILELNQWGTGEILRPYGTDWKMIVVPENMDTLFLQTEGFGMWSTINVYFESIRQNNNHWYFANWGQGYIIKGYIVNPKPGVYYIKYLDSAVLGKGGNTDDQTREYMIYCGVSGNPVQPNKPISITKLSETKFGNCPVSFQVSGINLHLIDGVSVTDADNNVFEASSFGIDSSDFSLWVSFDFSGASLGNGELLFMSSSKGSSITKEIKIEEKGESNLVVEIIGREQLRTGRNQTYVVRVTNKGNYMVPYVFLNIHAPNDTSISIFLKHEVDSFDIIANKIYQIQKYPWIPVYLYNLAPGEIYELDLSVYSSDNKNDNINFEVFAHEISEVLYISQQKYWAEWYRNLVLSSVNNSSEIPDFLLSDSKWWDLWNEALIESGYISLPYLKSNSEDRIDNNFPHSRGRCILSGIGTLAGLAIATGLVANPGFWPCLGVAALSSLGLPEWAQACGLEYEDAKGIWDYIFGCNKYDHLKKISLIETPNGFYFYYTFKNSDASAVFKIHATKNEFYEYFDDSKIQVHKFKGLQVIDPEWGEEYAGEIEPEDVGGIVYDDEVGQYNLEKGKNINTMSNNDNLTTNSPCIPCYIKTAWQTIELIFSTTPEDKYGPVGSSVAINDSVSHHYIDTSAVFEYKIDYWNKEDATAPAAIVYIRDTLDTDFNLATLNFTEIGFLKWKVKLDGGQYFNVNVDCRPDMPYIVNVEGTVDPDTREVFWVHTTLDPSTMEIPEDPLSGYLPPIDSTGYQVGWVNYTIKANSNLPDGTIFTNQAFVNFDGVGKWGPAPKEGPYTNIFDLTPPVSEVIPLKANTTSDSILVQWTGNDSGSGVDYFTILVSEGGEYSIWINYTTDTSAYFVGEAGKTYTFYSIARDKVGNLEPDKDDYEALVTFLTSDIEYSFLEDNHTVFVYPNPSLCCYTVETGLNTSRFDVQVFNIIGKCVYSAQPVKNKFEIDLSNQPKGIYYLKINDKKTQYNSKLILK